jgi:hypothetical protein
MAYAELTADQGATFTATIDLANDDGTPINVANNTFLSQVRKSYYSSNVVANLSIAVSDSANGNLRLSLDSANTANVKPGRYVYDVKMTSNTGAVTRILEGIITVTPQVTR